MMIKIIDWMTRIIAVLLAIEGSLCVMSVIGAMLAMDANEIEPRLVNIITILIPIFCSVLQLGLFLASVTRQKGIICRVIIGVLMLPSLLILFAIVIHDWGKMLHNILCGIIGSGVFGVNMREWDMKDINMFIMFNISIIVYITQYYLLFKGKNIKEYSQNE